MAFKVYAVAGHGGKNSTPGKRTPNGEYEWNFNAKVVDAFIDELSKYEGVEIKRGDDASGNTDVPLSTRTNEANAWGADIYVSEHHNANTGTWGTWTGTETYYYEGSEEGRELAELLHNAALKAYGLRDRGIKRGNHLWEMRKTTMPAVLVEGGFMDSRVDIQKMRDDDILEKSGRLQARAVAEYAGLTEGKSAKKEQPKKKPAPKKKPTPKKQNKANLTVDGFWGPNTTRELQKALGTIADGVISGQTHNNATAKIYGGITFGGGGSLVIKALQKKIGSTADGLLGPNTVKALQRYLGTPVDGKISEPSMVVKELQRRLNKATF